MQTFLSLVGQAHPELKRPIEFVANEIKELRKEILDSTIDFSATLAARKAVEKERDEALKEIESLHQQLDTSRCGYSELYKQISERAEETKDLGDNLIVLAKHIKAHTDTYYASRSNDSPAYIVSCKVLGLPSTLIKNN